MDVLDFERFKKYLTVVLSLQDKYGGKTLIDSKDHVIISGKPKQVLVVVEFPDDQSLNDFLNSSELAEVDHIRESATDGWMVQVKEKKFEGMKML